MTTEELQREIERLEKENQYLIRVISEIDLCATKEPLNVVESVMKESYKLSQSNYKQVLYGIHLSRIQSLTETVLQLEGVEKVERC